MGRKRKNNPLNLPERVYWKNGAFHYFHRNGHWEHLGTDVEVAKRRAGSITHTQGDGYGTVAYWLDEFIAWCAKRVKVNDLAPRTLADYTEACVPLKAFFGAMFPAGVEPSHVGDYLDTGLEMGRAVRANRERACLSSMFTWLIRNGKANVKINPCIGIKRNRETKRERYVEHDEMRATLASAPVQVRGLAELVYRTLQRPEDIITWTPRNITQRRAPDGRMVDIIRNTQGKTGTTVDIEITPEIRAALALLKLPPEKKANGKAQNKVVTGLTLIHRRDGHPYTYDGLCAMLKRRQSALRAQHKVSGGPHANMASWGFYDLKGKGATDMWQAGDSLEKIQVLCGHATIKTTEIYVKARWRGIVMPNRVNVESR